jgi:hypothetical protein
MVVELMEKCSTATAAALASTPSARRSARRTAFIQAMEQLQQEAGKLRQSLLSTYTGERLRRTLDWAMSSVNDDVSMFTKRLTEMERRLFLRGASATAAHVQWKTFANRRIAANDNNLSVASKIVSPPEHSREDEDQRPSKRIKSG